MEKKKKKTNIFNAIVEIFGILYFFGTVIMLFYCSNHHLDKHIPFLFIQFFAVFPAFICLDSYVGTHTIHPFPAFISVIFFTILFIYLFNKRILIQNALNIIGAVYIILGIVFLLIAFKDKLFFNKIYTEKIPAKIIAYQSTRNHNSQRKLYAPTYEYIYKGKNIHIHLTSFQIKN